MLQYIYIGADTKSTKYIYNDTVKVAFYDTEYYENCLIMNQVAGPNVIIPKGIALN